jgi:hypothetical protein
LFQLIKQTQQLLEIAIETMRETVDGAIAELDRGEGRDGEEVIAELYDRLYQKTRAISF